MITHGKPGPHWTDWIDEFDEVWIGGRALEPEREFPPFHGVVATVDRENGYLKVWPKNLVAVGAGNVWFRFDGVATCLPLYYPEN